MLSLRSVWRFVGVIAVEAILLGLLALIVPGFEFSDPAALIPAALVIIAVQSVIWPVVYAIAARFGPWLFPLLSFVLSGTLISTASWVDDRFGIGGVEVASVWTGVLVSFGLSIGSTILAAAFAIDDEATYDRLVTVPLRRRFRDVPKTNEPGFLFLEIDGLSEPVLHKAVAEGYMPTLKRWLDSGSHNLLRWDPDLSAQTSASQAGILLGSNQGIPAFRWWDKPRQQLMVSSKMRTAHLLEEELSNGNGLLVHGGAGRWNAFSGNAADNIGVFSVFGDGSRGSDNTLLGYLISPYMLGRILTLFVVDVVREWWQAWQQRRQDVRPRVHRGLKYSFVRAGTTTAMQEASRHILTSDMLRGVPQVYNTFFGYDEVAHHSGIDRPDALKILATLDRIFAHLERVAEHAPRPYHLIVLSDHGQSQGATFRQKYGKTLGDVTRELIADHRAMSMTEIARDDEALGHMNAALSEAVIGESTAARMLRGLLKRRMTDGQVQLERDGDALRLGGAPEVTDVIVLASGNLGIISFPQWKELMTFEEIEQAFPRLLPGLIDHPGISIALVTSSVHGPLAIGKRGIAFLRTGKVEGEDPIVQFGPHAARHLHRAAEFPNVPDILVISAVDWETGEVPAFEELVGNHGGLGGWQREPFVLYPSIFSPPDGEIVGAGHLHELLKAWMAESRARTAAPDGGQEPSPVAAGADEAPPAGTRQTTARPA